MPPSCFGYTGLNVLLACFFLLSVVTSVILTQRSYNTTAATDWILVGALSPAGANFKVRLSPTYPDKSRFVVSTTPALDASESNFYVWTEPLLLAASNNSSNNNNDESNQLLLVQSITVESLDSDTVYYYGVVSPDGQQHSKTAGQFRTAPAVGIRSNFSFAVAGCAMTGSEHGIFRDIAAAQENDDDDDKNILFFLHLGDFHYLDINSEDLRDRMAGIDRVMGSSAQAALWSTTAMAVMWDDHDWLGNDSTGYSVGRETALESYRQAFPYPQPLPSANSSSSGSSGGVYHAFTIGTVRFILSDLRSERTVESIYSTEQKEWLFAELRQADQYDFVIWVTPSPWIGPADEHQDNWMGAPADRQQLSSFISSTLATTQNLLAVSADAHMLAFDDGSHTFYGDSSSTSSSSNATTTNSNNVTLSFPILHSGPLDRLGSIKGGPYSDGCTTYKYERNHQYSVISFIGNNNDDNADEQEPCLEIRSYRVFEDLQRERIFHKRLCGQIFRSAQDAVEGTCEEVLFSTTNLALIASASCMLVLVLIESCFLDQGRGGAALVSAFCFVWFALTLVAGFYIPTAQGYAQFDTFPVALIGFLQIGSVVLYLMGWICDNNRKKRSNNSDNNNSIGDNNNDNNNNNNDNNNEEESAAL